MSINSIELNRSTLSLAPAYSENVPLGHSVVEDFERGHYNEVEDMPPGYDGVRTDTEVARLTQALETLRENRASINGNININQLLEDLNGRGILNTVNNDDTSSFISTIPKKMFRIFKFSSIAAVALLAVATLIINYLVYSEYYDKFYVNLVNYSRCLDNNNGLDNNCVFEDPHYSPERFLNTIYFSIGVAATVILAQIVFILTISLSLFQKMFAAIKKSISNRNRTSEPVVLENRESSSIVIEGNREDTQNSERSESIDSNSQSEEILLV